MQNNRPQGLYVHIPFCQSRCIYCDFFSTTSHSMRPRYVDALCREAYLRSRQLGNSGRSIRTVYLGGGTPSQLDIAHLDKLFDTLSACFDLLPDAEITMEANPDDISDDFLRGLRNLPINRLSFGVQTFSDTRLRFLHRRHTARQAMDTVARCQDAGYHNISIDPMFGFPGETVEDWADDVEKVIRMGVQHISAYALMYEEGTPLYRMLERGEVEEVDEEVSRGMYETLIRRLKNEGYEHYEISNFAQPGFASRHNSAYWEGVPYIGLGAGAHSYDGENRSWNVCALSEYIDGVSQGRRPCEEEILTPAQKYDEYVMVRLRTVGGVDLQVLKEKFGSALLDYFLRMARPHILGGRLKEDNGKVHLSEEGIFVSDDVMSDCMWDE